MKEKWVDFKEIKSKVSMEDVLSRYGLLEEMRRKGGQLSGRCPIHGGTRMGQFSASPEKGAWHCFGDCKSGGNVIDFVAAMEKVEFREAALLMADWFGIAGRKKSGGRRPMREKKKAPEPGKPGAGAEGDGPPPEVNPTLGFELKRLDPEHEYLEGRALAPATIEHFGLGYQARGSLAGRIAIPVHDERGNLVCYDGRAVTRELEDEAGKYKLPARERTAGKEGKRIVFDKSRLLFNFHRAAEDAAERGLIVVEGYFDVFRLHQAGFPNALALIGSSMSEYQEGLIAGAVGPEGRVCLMLDGDEAGRACARDAAKRLVSRAYVKVVSLEDGQQPDDLDEEEARKLLRE